MLYNDAKAQHCMQGHRDSTKGLIWNYWDKERGNRAQVEGE